MPIRFPQFYFRIGFVLEFRPLSAVEIRGLLAWSLRAIELPSMASVDRETIATIIRITGGNFRLHNSGSRNSLNYAYSKETLRLKLPLKLFAQTPVQFAQCDTAMIAKLALGQPARFKLSRTNSAICSRLRRFLRG